LCKQENALLIEDKEFAGIIWSGNILNAILLPQRMSLELQSNRSYSQAYHENITFLSRNLLKMGCFRQDAKRVRGYGSESDPMPLT
jgi:hypothetical protein